eukprot:3121874-Prymnesium_polylepis.1
MPIERQCAWSTSSVEVRAGGSVPRGCVVCQLSSSMLACGSGRAVRCRCASFALGSPLTEAGSKNSQ